MISFLKKRWYVIVILCIGLGFYLYQQKTTQAKVEKEKTHVVARQDMKELLSLAGQIGADEHVVLRFPTSGRLAWVGVKEGDVVKKYQSLATLDQRELKKNLQKKLLSYAQTRNTFDQSGSDNQRIGDQPTTDWGLGDKMKRLLENAQYTLDSSVLDVELTNISLEYSNLFTPIEGIVTRVDSQYAGVNITAAQAEFEIINPNTLYFSFTADQTEVTKLVEGMKGEINLDSFPDSTKKGALYYVSYTPKTGESGTVYEGRVRIADSSTTHYKFGMTGDVSFVLSEKNNVVVVPDKLVKSEGDKKFVWKKVNNNQIKTYIKTGLETDGVVEVLSGVEAGDIVLNIL